jgi:hypothetical protein
MVPCLNNFLRTTSWRRLGEWISSTRRGRVVSFTTWSLYRGANFPVLAGQERRDSKVDIATGYGLDDWVVGVLCPGGSNNFHFCMLSRLVLGPSQPPTQWIQGALSLGVKWPGMKLAIHHQLVPRTKKCGSCIHSPVRLHGVVFNQLSRGTLLQFVILAG